MSVIPTEHQEQAMLFRWSEAMKGIHPELEWLVAVPNFSGRMGKLTIIHGAKLKREGRKRGYPDLILDVARGPYHGLRIEMKRQKGGTVSPEQKAWHVWLRSQGYHVAICKSSEEAQRTILEYLTMPTWTYRYLEQEIKS